MTKTISFNDLRRIKDSLPDGSMHKIADKLNCTVQTVRNYFGGSNYQFGQNVGVHIEPGPDGGIVVLDDTTIYDMAITSASRLPTLTLCKTMFRSRRAALSAGCISSVRPLRRPSWSAASRGV